MDQNRTVAWSRAIQKGLVEVDFRDKKMSISRVTNLGTLLLEVGDMVKTVDVSEAVDDVSKPYTIYREEDLLLVVGDMVPSVDVDYETNSLALTEFLDNKSEGFLTSVFLDDITRS